MSSIINLQQRLAELSRQLTSHDLTEDERDDIEAEIADIEYEMEEAYNSHDEEEDY